MIAKTMVRIRGSYALEPMFQNIPSEVHFYNLNGDEIEKETTEIKWDTEAAEKARYEHFMMKEIHEQPKAILDTLAALRLAKKKGLKKLAVQFAFVKGKITEEEYRYYNAELLTIPDKLQKMLEDKNRIQWFTSKYANAHDVFLPPES